MNTSHALTEPHTPPSSGAGLLAWFPLLLAAYVLSSGPAAKLVELGIISESTLEPFYVPLVWAMKHFAPMREFIYWYLGCVWNIFLGQYGPG
jgi:hypothetical protein